MGLELLEIPPPGGVPLPPEAASLVADAGRRVEAFLHAARSRLLPAFVPSDASLVYRTLARLRAADRPPARLCEWGSGFATVAGLAALLGYESCGIEIEPRLVEASRRLLADHGIEAPIAQGSFVPDGYREPSSLADHDFVTILAGGAAYGKLDLAPDDFDLIFAYPWPGGEPLIYHLFERYADRDALLVTYEGIEGMRVQRKQPRRGRR